MTDPRLKERRAEVFPYHYEPKKRLVHIVVRISNEPGSLGAILDLLAHKVDLVGTSTYLTPEGSAVFSGFAAVLDKGESVEKLREMLMSSSRAIDAYVAEGSEGMLVDSFHTGIRIADQAYMRFRREGLSKVFDRVVELFGTGGDTLIHSEGVTLGKDNAKGIIKLVGADMAVKKTEDLRLVLRAMGWGHITVPELDEDVRGVVQVADCFECCSGSKVRGGCHFFRGYLEGYASTLYGLDLTSEETRCTLRDEQVCEFVIKPREP
ncbi:MAG: hypothetical protein HY247_03150 [archaeon]|nr:MAG: hypothetical protein HY247_03150 [archaeon]